MKYLWAFNLVIALIIVAVCLYRHELREMLGWLCASWYLIVLLIKETNHETT
jgi:hypothetical protein